MCLCYVISLFISFLTEICNKCVSFFLFAFVFVIVNVQHFVS